VGTRIRVGFLLTELVGGGAERTMLSVIDALDRDRFDPVLILFDSRAEHEPPSNTAIHVLPRRGISGAGRLWSRVRDLAALIRREDLDLVVSFLIGPNIVATAASGRAGVPVIIGERSAPRIVLSRENRDLSARWLWSWLVRSMYPRASSILTNTEGAKQELIDFLGVPHDRVTVVPNPIDIDRIHRLAEEPLDDPDLAASGAVLVHVGRFSYAKNHDLLLQAFAEIRRQRAVRLVLVGSGEDEGRVNALCTALGLDDAVTFIGFTPNPYKYVARATLSVLTSRFEGLPNALIEAMALGIPIVSTAAPFGPIELLKDGRGGELTPPGDAAAFARAVVALLDDPARRRRLGEEGRARAREFDRRQIAHRYESLFERFATRRAVEAAAPDGSLATETQRHRD
jgi:glycosyltransferase involved in cell wall biosynthesis